MQPDRISGEHSDRMHARSRSHLKNVFQPNICVGSKFRFLDIFNICLRLETWIRLDLEPKSYF